MRGLFPVFLILLLCVGTPLGAQEPSALQIRYQPSFHKGRIISFIRDIRQQTGISVSFASSVLDSNRRVSVARGAANLELVFQYLLAGQAVEAVESNGGILLIPRIRSERALAYRVVTGRIREKGSGEVLIGAAVYVPALRTGGLTNDYGLYQLALPEGTAAQVSVSYIGFEADTFDVPPTGNFRQDMDLVSNSRIGEVRVRAREESLPGDRSRLHIAESRPQAQAFGALDPVRDLQLEAGVQPGVAGASGLIVRGGSPGQNLYLLDGVPLYYADHFFGLTSVYNGDALKSVDFYKSAFPSRYGGRISSVIDARGRDGDLQHWGGEASLSLVRAALSVEGPVVKDKLSFIASGRRSWIDGLMQAVPEAPSAYFYDVNAKLQWVLNDNHRLYAGIYSGRDELRLSEDSPAYYQRLRWNNTVASLRWSAILSPRVLFDATAAYSAFSFDQKDLVQEPDSAGKLLSKYLMGNSAIRDFSVNGQFQWNPGLTYRAVAGVRFARTEFQPSAMDRQIPSAVIGPTGSISSLFDNNELSLYAENTLRLGGRWTIRPGVHTTLWAGGLFRYVSIQPRFYMAFRRSPGESWYLSAGRMGQFLHLLTSNSFGLSNDFWVPSTARIRPEESWYANLGMNKAIRPGLNLNIEGYYRYTDGIISSVTGQNYFDNSDRWQDKITQGIGWTYGGEAAVLFNKDAWSAKAAYALSWSWQQFEALNSGNAFPYRYDRRHNLNFRVTYAPSHRFDATAQWIYMTGEAFTLPDQLYPDLDNNLNTYTFAGGTRSPNFFTYQYSDWNAYRLPDVHRLDLGVNFTRRRGLRFTRIWSAGIYNAYARPNINFVSLHENANGSVSLQGIALLRFMPYVALRVKF